MIPFADLYHRTTNCISFGTSVKFTRVSSAFFIFFRPNVKNWKPVFFTHSQNYTGDNNFSIFFLFCLCSIYIWVRHFPLWMPPSQSPPQRFLFHPFSIKSSRNSFLHVNLGLPNFSITRYKTDVNFTASFCLYLTSHERKYTHGEWSMKISIMSEHHSARTHQRLNVSSNVWPTGPPKMKL